MRIKASQKDGSAVDRRADAAGLGRIRELILHIAAPRIYAHKSHRRTEANAAGSAHAQDFGGTHRLNSRAGTYAHKEPADESAVTTTVPARPTLGTTRFHCVQIHASRNRDRRPAAQ